HLPDEMVAVYQKEGGFVLSERAIVAHVMAAQSLGAEIHACERVIEWIVERGSVRVVTDRDRYEADRLVITAGPWAGKAVAALGSVLAPERQALIWAQPLRPQYFHVGAFPVFILEAPEGTFYGLPVYGVRGFKLGKHHHLGQQVDPDNMNRSCNREDEEV